MLLISVNLKVHVFRLSWLEKQSKIPKAGHSGDPGHPISHQLYLFISSMTRHYQVARVEDGVYYLVIISFNISHIFCVQIIGQYLDRCLIFSYARPIFNITLQWC